VLSATTFPVEFFTLEMCPYAQRVWIVMEELQIPYTTTLVNARDKTAWYLKEINPRGKVPAIRDAATGAVVYESLIINEYLADRFDGAHALLPSEPAARATLRLWNEHLDTQLAPAHFTLLMNKNETQAVAKEEALRLALQRYEEGIVGPYLLGDAFTLADAAALPFFERLVFSLEHFKAARPLDDFPRTKAWFKHASARASFEATRRPKDKLVELYERFLSVDYKFGGLNKS